MKTNLNADTDNSREFVKLYEMGVCIHRTARPPIAIPGDPPTGPDTPPRILSGWVDKVRAEATAVCRPRPGGCLPVVICRVSALTGLPISWYQIQS